MHYFHNDYNEICHPVILEWMQKNAGLQMDGYGEDPACTRAANRIRSLCGIENLAVHFLMGGTQTNLTVIAAALRPHHAVIGADGAHIYVHETGAIEATGHKVLPLPSENGKITATQVQQTLQAHLSDATHEHIARPKMVYISQPTELGTLYTLQELEDISRVCKEYDLYLFVDGARLGYGIMAKGNDVFLPDLARIADVFYIGGTKVGAMFGEAVVISNPAIAEDFRYLMKQRGAMLAKGWLLGLQFEALLQNELYFKIAAEADLMADKIRETARACGYPIVAESTTNQVFVVLPDEKLQQLKEEFTCSDWGRVDAAHTCVRFCTSWATTWENVDALCEALK